MQDQPKADVIAIATAKLPRRERERYIKRRDTAEAAKRDGRIPITSMAAALEWGDGWVAAYLELERDVRRVVDEYEHRVLMLRSDLTCEQAARIVERIALQDEIERLRALIA